MRKLFHFLFPNWVSPPPSQREPTDLERLEALIKQQQTTVLEARVQAARAASEQHQAKMLLDSLINIEDQMQ